MTVSDYIKRIRHLDNELTFKQRQRAELLDMLVSTTAPLSEPVQKTTDDKISVLMAQYVDLGNEVIDIYIRKFKAENEFQSLISQLPPQQEEFLLLRYLEGKSIDAIAAEMGYSREWCWKTGNKARIALKELLDAQSLQ